MKNKFYLLIILILPILFGCNSVGSDISTVPDPIAYTTIEMSEKVKDTVLVYQTEDYLYVYSKDGKYIEHIYMVDPKVSELLLILTVVICLAWYFLYLLTKD
jgi:hypothetical protein